MNDAVEIVVSHSPAVSRISKTLRHAFGRVAAEDLAAPHGQPVLYPFADQDSALIRNCAEADVLIKRPANALGADIGESVPVIPLERL